MVFGPLESKGPIFASIEIDLPTATTEFSQTGNKLMGKD